MFDPFKIDGPTCIKVSGGRTSALLAWETKMRNGGIHPDALFVFNNTGKEGEEALEFVRDIGIHWGIPIEWIEYRRGPSYAVVDYESASRNGEPFEALIRQRIEEGVGGLPNAVNRYCSSELKTRTTIRYLRDMGWTEWDTFVGYRADEPRRYMKLSANPHPETKAETLCAPLAKIGVSKHDVAKFWREQAFDLGQPNINGQTYHGNCDLCFLKHPTVVRSLIAERPSRATWWIKQEQYARSMGRTTGALFADDRESIERMLDTANKQVDFVGHEEPDYMMLPCACGD